jgi:hypothetical protein
MCEYGTHGTVMLDGGSVILRTIDACIVPIVQALNDSGIETIASCCGHGNTCGSIVLKGGREILIARNYSEARSMERVIPTDIHGNITKREFMKPSIGRIVIFKLTEELAQQINRRRTTGSSIAERIYENLWPIGAQAHIGSPVNAGEEYPMIITRVWPDEFGSGDAGIGVNGQVFLDGNDCLWVTSVGWGQDAGQWKWPERV